MKGRRERAAQRVATYDHVTEGVGAHLHAQEGGEPRTEGSRRWALALVRQGLAPCPMYLLSGGVWVIGGWFSTVTGQVLGTISDADDSPRRRWHTYRDYRVLQRLGCPMSNSATSSTTSRLVTLARRSFVVEGASAPHAPRHTEQVFIGMRAHASCAARRRTCETLSTRS